MRALSKNFSLKRENFVEVHVKSRELHKELPVSKVELWQTSGIQRVNLWNLTGRHLDAIMRMHVELSLFGKQVASFSGLELTLRLHSGAALWGRF